MSATANSISHLKFYLIQSSRRPHNRPPRLQPAPGAAGPGRGFIKLAGKQLHGYGQASTWTINWWSLMIHVLKCANTKGQAIGIRINLQFNIFIQCLRLKLMSLCPTWKNRLENPMPGDLLPRGCGQTAQSFSCILHLHGRRMIWNGWAWRFSWGLWWGLGLYVLWLKQSYMIIYDHIYVYDKEHQGPYNHECTCVTYQGRCTNDSYLLPL